MKTSKRKSRARKATYIAFGLVVLAAASCAHAEVVPNDARTDQLVDPAAEASRAYKQAMSTLAHMNAHPYAHRDEAAHGAYGTQGYPTSFWSALLPNIQGQGPIASAMRIALKLRHQTWIPSFVTSFLGKELGGGRKKEEELQSKAVKVIDLLQHAAELGHTDALYALSQLYLFPPNSFFPAEPGLAFEALHDHASVTGNASSQALLGFFHATGYHDAVPIDQAKAQLYLTFAGHGGHKGAQMAMGYRYWSGIGVAEDCMTALGWYEQAAEHAMAKFLTGPPGGRTLPLIPPRLSDLEGGVYGPGASVASTGLNAARPVIKTANARAAGETWDDLLEYYSFNADRGEVDFAYRLGKIFYQGSIYGSLGGIASGGDGASRVQRDYHTARYYFMRIARQVWPRDPANPRKPEPTSKEDRVPNAGYAALAAGYLGRMYLRGEGVKQDPALAKMWFERGAEYGEKECYNGLGIIWRDGLVDGKKDMKKALSYFQAAASHELAEAQVQLGKYHYSRGDLKLATAFFEAAIRQGSPFEAYYYLADIQARVARNPTTPPEIAGSSCAIAVSFNKLVAERGVWEDNLLHDAEVAWNSGTKRGKELAMLKWWIAAERGFEVAQNNLAFVLDQDKSILRFTRFAPYSPSNDTARLALTQWTRSAAQRNIDALVKVGDYYYHGLGVPDEPASIRYEKAAGYYQSAADTQMSALAMWNLGWMYENGVGVPQDFHLAKRHYDSALETNSEAYVPVIMSLVKLHAKSLWYALLGGPDNLNLWNYDLEEEQAAQAASMYREIDEGRHAEGEESYHVDEEDGPWYPGRAREEFDRRRRGQERAEYSEDDDPVLWARNRRREESEREGDFGPEDYFEGAVRGGYRGEEEVDQFIETMILVLLCVTVSVLLYVRGRWVERLRREEQQRQQEGNGAARPPPQAGGAYPAPRDPPREQWPQ